jgi:hypothetical protein
MVKGWFRAQGHNLHILGYHEEVLPEEEVVKELEKARKHVGDIESILMDVRK